MPRCLAFSVPLLAALAALTSCGADAPGTSVQVTVSYDDALGLDTVDVTLGNRTESARLAHQLLLLVPDELAGADMPIAVWARRAGKRSAYGTARVVPEKGKTTKVALALTTCTPSCSGDTFNSCTGPATSCVLGCSETGDTHCVAPAMSNGVDPGLATGLGGLTTIAADTTIDVDTGEITGGVARPPGLGVEAGIAYAQLPGVGRGAPLAVFAFHDLQVAATATVRFIGTRAAVVLVGNSAEIYGSLDLTGGRGARSTPGPGGGAGGVAGQAAGGCGPGGAGAHGVSADDSGGGGGGGGTAGAAGGASGGTAGGAGGVACLPSTLEPLQGGSGGGTGSPGGAPGPALGGGGGGALQISALGSLLIAGRINAGGAGGEGGPTATSDAGAGAGGGAGGAILVEAPQVDVTASAILAANGGGGGGAGASGTTPGPGMPGASGGLSRTPAAGGLAGGVGTNDGGDGGAGGTSPTPGVTASGGNAGGSGGAVGVIVIRARRSTVVGVTSPTATKLDVVVGP